MSPIDIRWRGRLRCHMLQVRPGWGGLNPLHFWSLHPKAEQLELHVLSPNFVLGLGPAESPRLIRGILSVLTWN